MPYEDQIALAMAELKTPWLDGKPLFDRIFGVKGDSTGQSDMPMEFLRRPSSLPVDDGSHVKFSLQSKNAPYMRFEQASFRDASDKMRFSYPADHPLTAEFEDQMTGLVRECKGDGEHLSMHHLDESSAKGRCS